MTNTVAKGQYFKQRSKRWLEAHGFVVASGHITGWLKTGAGRFVPFTRDIFGADLLAVMPQMFWLVQCKGGTHWRGEMAAARRRFARYPVAVGSAQVIMGWAPNAREPDILMVASGPQPAEHPVIVPPRRQPKVLPLFQASAR